MAGCHIQLGTQPGTRSCGGGGGFRHSPINSIPLRSLKDFMDRNYPCCEEESKKTSECGCSQNNEDYGCCGRARSPRASSANSNCSNCPIVGDSRPYCPTCKKQCRVLNNCDHCPKGLCGIPGFTLKHSNRECKVWANKLKAGKRQDNCSCMNCNVGQQASCAACACGGLNCTCKKRGWCYEKKEVTGKITGEKRSVRPPKKECKKGVNSNKCCPNNSPNYSQIPSPCSSQIMEPATGLHYAEFRSGVVTEYPFCRRRYLPDYAKTGTYNQERLATKNFTLSSCPCKACKQEKSRCFSPYRVPRDISSRSRRLKVRQNRDKMMNTNTRMQFG